MASSNSPDSGFTSSVKFAKLKGVAKQMNCSGAKMPESPAAIDPQAATAPNRQATDLAAVSALLMHSDTMAPMTETTVDISSMFIPYPSPLG